MPTSVERTRFLNSLVKAVLALVLLLILGTGITRADVQVLTWMDGSDIAAVVRPLSSIPALDPLLDAPASLVVTATSFQVVRMIKGPQQSQLTIYGYRPYRGSDPTATPRSMTEYDPKSMYLVLANHRLNGHDLFLTSSNADSASAVEISPSLAPPVSGLTPLEAVLNLLMANAASPGQTPLDQTYAWIGSYGPLLWNRIPLWDEDTRDLLSRVPDIARLTGTLIQSGIPDVEEATRSPNVSIAISALEAAAELQQVDAIPRLAAFAHQHSADPVDLEAALASYHCVSAAPALGSVLKSSPDAVWRGALASIDAIADSGSIPAVLPLLKSPTQDERYLAVTALYDLTGDSTYPTPEEYAANEKQYVDYWTNWAISHKQLQGNL